MPISILLAGIFISLSIILGANPDLSINLGGGGSDTASDECTTASPLSDACLQDYAEELGLDGGQFASCVENHETADIVDAEYAAGVDTGVQGTPSLYVGKGEGDSFDGFYIGGVLTYDEIDDVLTRLANNSVKQTQEYWLNQQLKALTSFRQQVVDYYKSADGGSLKGKKLNTEVNAYMKQQRDLIQNEFALKKLTVGDGKVRGEGNVVLMEFSDYECPYCQELASQTIAQVKDNYVDAGMLRFIYRDFPLEDLHPRARSAAEAARCAGEQGKYFDYHDKLFSI